MASSTEPRPATAKAREGVDTRKKEGTLTCEEAQGLRRNISGAGGGWGTLEEGDERRAVVQPKPKKKAAAPPRKCPRCKSTDVPPNGWGCRVGPAGLCVDCLVEWELTEYEEGVFPD